VSSKKEEDIVTLKYKVGVSNGVNTKNQMEQTPKRTNKAGATIVLPALLELLELPELIYLKIFL
jgi:hypothetical protein